MGLLAVLLSMTSSALAGVELYSDQQLLVETPGYRVIHPSEITISKQVAPKYPKKAMKEGYRHEECTAQLLISDSGKPDEVTVVGDCPEPFHKPLVKGLKKWRFEPVTGESGEPEPVTFVLRIRFERG